MVIPKSLSPFIVSTFSPLVTHLLPPSPTPETTHSKEICSHQSDLPGVSMTIAQSKWGVTGHVAPSPRLQLRIGHGPDGEDDDDDDDGCSILDTRTRAEQKLYGDALE